MDQSVICIEADTCVGGRSTKMTTQEEGEGLKRDQVMQVDYAYMS